jgi:hypothetical protein
MCKTPVESRSFPRAVCRAFYGQFVALLGKIYGQFVAQSGIKIRYVLPVLENRRL